MGGGFDSKPGGRSLIQPALDVRGTGTPGPGKQTLTEQLGRGPTSIQPSAQPVQRKAADGSRGALPASDAQADASQGVAGAASPLPHLSTIQRAFGRHDIGSARAQVGGAATDASQAIGAKAYAQGERVGFASAPDLHTAAHEAAHVVQQRAGHAPAGGLDTPGDPLERHADEVADAVVAGKPAEGLLDRFAGGGSSTSAVQRKADDVAPPSPAKQRRMMELYLAGNQTHVWNVVGDHARSVHFPDPHPRHRAVRHDRPRLRRDRPARRPRGHQPGWIEP